MIPSDFTTQLSSLSSVAESLSPSGSLTIVEEGRLEVVVRKTLGVLSERIYLKRSAFRGTLRVTGRL